MQDLRQALRTLRKSPVFTLTAVLTLTLGIGVNVAVFSVFNAVILKPLPFAEVDTLVELVIAVNGVPRDMGAPVSTYLFWREQTEVLEDVAAYRKVPLNYTGGDVPERIAAGQVSAAFFRTFRAPLMLGRTFSAEEEQSGAPRTAVLGYDFWSRRLGADADVVGKRVLLGGVPHTVIGVTAPAFDTRELGRADLWVPLALDPAKTDDMQYRVAARLKAGVSLAQAQARLAASTRAFRDRVETGLRDGAEFSAMPFKDAMIGAADAGESTVIRGDSRRTLGLLSGAVVLVLLIACANVASLLFVRAGVRARELAVRAALGAGRWRLARQLLAEGAVLAVIGGALGLGLGYLGIRVLLAVNTAGLPRLGEGGALLGLDWHVVAFAISASLVTVLLAALVPALAAARVDAGAAIKGAVATASAGRRQTRGRALLVIAEIGLAIVLLIGAGLLIRTLLALNTVDPGFNVRDVVVLDATLSEERFQSTSAMTELSRTTLERIRALPGVEAATTTCCVPLVRSWGEVFKVVGRDDAGRPFSGGADVTIGTGDYFDVFEIPLVRGRLSDARDAAGASPVVVINRALAERWWPDGRDPIGERIRIGGGHDEPEREIVGIVENVRKARLDIVRPILYVPLAQISDAWLRSNLEVAPLVWAVRASVDPLTLAGALRAELERATGVPVADVRPMRAIVADSISRQRASMLLMAVFGGIALALAAIGLYGLIAYSVQQRTHEIGIRLALGAERDRIVRMVLRQGLTLVAVGIALGLAAAALLVGLLSSFLFGVEPHDVAVFVGVPAVLGLVGLAAVAIPAYRASRVSPLKALRYE